MNEITRYLSADGAAVDVGALDVDDQRFAYLYEGMAATRIVDERAAQLHADGDIGFYVASRGLEALAVGTAAALESEDWLFPSHRDLGMFLLRGGSMRAWFDQVLGNAADITKGRQLPGHAALPEGRFVSVTGRVGAQIPQAVGCALAMKHRADAACAVASFGEAAAATPAYFSALELASRFRAPAVLVCRTVAVKAGASVGARDSLAERAESAGLRARRVDGGDVIAVYTAVREARAGAASGGGTTVVEAVVDGDLIFDDGADDLPQDLDPLVRMREFLENTGRWDTAAQDDMDERVRSRATSALAEAREEPRPAAHEMFEDVLADPPWMLQEQRERLLSGEGE